MRLTLLLCWLSLPLGVAAWHYGPGQDRVKHDAAGSFILAAEKALAAKDQDAAIEAYESALAALPEGSVTESRQLRLAAARTRMQGSYLSRAHDDLDALLKEVTADKTADPSLVSSVREATAQSRYYMTWLMRLEGVSEEEWEPEAEAARQHFKQLADEASLRGEKSAATARQADLENAIKLARMDLTELQGLPLPNQ